MHDRTGYTPYAGRTVTGWPETVLRRGEVIVRDGKLDAPAAARAPFLPRPGGVRGRPARPPDAPTWTPPATSAPSSSEGAALSVGCNRR